ncbi:MAG TPA: hypothetical protein DHV62_03685 [Elusimicrobia bacterium]|jgi:type IV pilus assembly protein PilO|nr:hypothetical protein [Elusimicrobiota bacterium]
MKLTKQHKILLVVGIIALIYVFYSYLWRPLGVKTKTVEKKITELKGKVQLARTNTQELERIKKEMESLTTELKEIESYLPKKKEIPSLLRNLTRMAEKYQVNITNLAPQSPNQRDYFVELPFSIQSVTNYHGLATFLTALAQSERIINTVNLRLTGQLGSEEKTISATFNLITYTFKEGSP